MQHPLLRTPTVLALGAALVVGAAACAPERAVAPQSEEPSLDPLIAARFAEGLNASLEDATARLAPSLDDELAAAALRGHLSELSGYLAAGDTARARAALARTSSALVSAGETPDAAAIGLVLDHTMGLLDGAKQEGSK